MHRVVSCSEGATTFCLVIKSIHHLLKASPITHIGCDTTTVQGLTLEIVYHEKYLCTLGLGRGDVMVGDTHIIKIQYVVLPLYISRTGVPCSLLHAVFVSSSHTRPDCACRLFRGDECVLVRFVFVIVGRALEV